MKLAKDSIFRLPANSPERTQRMYAVWAYRALYFESGREVFPARKKMLVEENGDFCYVREPETFELIYTFRTAEEAKQYLTLQLREGDR